MSNVGELTHSTSGQTKLFDINIIKSTRIALIIPMQLEIGDLVTKFYYLKFLNIQ